MAKVHKPQDQYQWIQWSWELNLAVRESEVRNKCGVFFPLIIMIKKINKWKNNPSPPLMKFKCIVFMDQLNLILYCVKTSPSFPSLFTETFRRCRGDKLGLCLSLGNTAASIHVMNSTYFPKERNYNNSAAFHVTNCSSEFFASLPLSL